MSGNALAYADVDHPGEMLSPPTEAPTLTLIDTAPPGSGPSIRALPNRLSVGPRSVMPSFVYVRPDALGRLPLKVDLAPGDDTGVTAYARAIGVGGVGPSVDDAIRDLLSTAVSLWEDLRATPARDLHPSGRALLHRLCAFLGG